MSNTLSKIIIFATGAAAGSVVTWAVLKRRYDQIIDECVQEGIDSYKEELGKLRRPSTKGHDCEDDLAEDDGKSNKSILDPYENIVRDLGYLAESPLEAPAKDDEEDMEDEDTEEVYGDTELVDPYVISNIECGELDDYEIVNLIYYADGVLAHINHDIIENIDELIGEESLKHFGEYEEDAVYVRNDNLQIDYVVLRDESDYWGVVNDQNAN